MISPREFQVLAANKIDAWEQAGVRSGVVAAPTGAGKTLIALMAVRRRMDRGQRGCLLVHRDHLVAQAAEQAREMGIRYGVVKSGWPGDLSAPFQIASVHTLQARNLTPAFDFVFGDEFHIANVHKFMLEKYPATFRVGFTATPQAAGGKPLAPYAQELLVAARPSLLLDKGWIVPPRMWVPAYPDLSHIRVLRGEFNEADLATAMQGLVGNVVHHWERHLRAKKVLTFAVNRAHAAQLEGRYRDAGARVGLIDGTTPDGVRGGLLARLGEGNLDVLINVAVFIEGFNLPDLDCVQLATATASLARFLQMCGRGCRAVPGKTEYTLVDHGGNVFRHMPPHLDRTWALGATSAAQKKARLDTGVRWCKVCFHVYALGPSSMTCPHCKTTAPVRAVRERFGVLIDVTHMVDLAALVEPQQQAKDHADKYRRALWAKAKGAKMGPRAYGWVKSEMDKFWEGVLKRP